MAQSALAVRAPADLSKDEIWRKCVTLARTRAREKAEELQLTEKFLDNGTIAVTTLAAGFLFTKFPQIETIGPVPVQPVLGGLALLYGMFGSGQIADRAENVGIALLAPYLYEKGAEFAIG